jgi:hypothetical protein
MRLLKVASAKPLTDEWARLLFRAAQLFFDALLAKTPAKENRDAKFVRSNFDFRFFAITQFCILNTRRCISRHASDWRTCSAHTDL